MAPERATHDWGLGGNVRETARVQRGFGRFVPSIRFIRQLEWPTGNVDAGSVAHVIS
jgi:hypothetical protein